MKLFLPYKSLILKRKLVPSAVALLLTASVSFLSNSAIAGQCIVGQVKEVGTWINPDANTTGITKAIFAEDCRDDSKTTCYGSGDERYCSITHGVKLVYTARLWGKCTPSDCYWGQVDGRYTSSNWLVFTYNQGYASRVVWGQVWSENNNWLRLIVDTDFVDPARSDYRFDKWMRRQ